MRKLKTKKIVPFIKNSFLNLKLTLVQMLWANVHLGHRRKFLNVKIKPYLLGLRNDVYILNLFKTIYQLKLIMSIITNLISLRNKLLVIKDKDAFNFKVSLFFKNVYFYDKKWIGGLLTNFKRIKYGLKFKEENSSRGGLRRMKRFPSLVFFFDVDLSFWAVAEASNLDLPIAAVIDSNINFLNIINYFVVGNNKSFESSYLYLNLLRNSVLKGHQKEILKILKIC